MGFGIVEIGTLTPRPQAGNPSPRIFRLCRRRAVINRMGFNNEGHDAAFARLKGLRRARRRSASTSAHNKDSDDFVADYVAGVNKFADLADYLTANISSPNTPGLRNLQAPEVLAALLARVQEARVKAEKRPPLLVKLAPDIADSDLP